ncbi:hypothetical protein GCM10007242_44650 [Pigmentiphaga litoralis]|uniref:HeH/LEM domain-containing protein n=1 Tax=Pigmentiphaga litoralis TaxID=516702 RepID=UPI001989D8D0|nr:HeH/LEM domain-containing protein [Pigmentiphaga litoralis]GGX32767.1 hypothetical protein GCM10007242_44650 [Pigmentiphaga litoralis]
MAKVTKAFRGVPYGAVYPVEYPAGAEIPAELEAGAAALGVLDEVHTKDMSVADLKAALDTQGIAYEASAKKSDLQKLLDSAV